MDGSTINIESADVAGPRRVMSDFRFAPNPMVSTLARNDIGGAMAIYEAAWKETNGNVSGDLVQVMFTLQDSSDAQSGT